MPKRTKPSINFEFLSLGNLIFNNFLQVPLYQRAYSWEEKQVNDLFEDIINTLENNKEDVYFIGTIVTTSGENNLEVIDGQQRLATITMLIAAIRDYFYENNDNDRVEQITNKYLRTKDLKTLELIPKLKLNSSDNDFFCKYILADPKGKQLKNVQPLTLSNEKILFAYKLIKEKLKILLETFDDNDLIDIIEFIHINLSVVHITVADDSNAFTIFETLNDRGLSLAISDLLKNYLFGLSGDRLEEVKSYWTTMFNLLESQDDKKIIIDYLRHFYSAKYKVVREKDLYSDIKRNIKSKSQAVLFSKDLSENAFKYLAILISDHDIWKSYPTETKENIKTLNRLGFVQVRPLLLAITANFSKSNAQKAITFLVALTVRLLIIGTSGSGSIEESYCRAAQKIYKQEITRIVELKNELKNITPTNLAFKKSFSNSTVTKHYIARYYLLTIENYLRENNNSELYPTSDENKLNLEHILPQNQGDQWNHFSKEEHKTYYKRIGNLTLLSSKINSKLKSDEYKSKKKELDKSELEINKHFKNIASWNKSEIDKRQGELANIAVKAWKI